MKNKQLIYSFIFYFLGAVSLIFLDLLITREFTDEITSEWASIKSFVMIFGSFLFLGANNMIIRFPNEKFKIINYVIVVGFLTTILIYVVLLFFKSPLESVFYLISTFLFSLILLISSYYRSILYIKKAQFFQNFWKFILLLIFIFLSKGKLFPNLVSLSLISALFISLIISFFLSLKKQQIKKIRTNLSFLNLPNKYIRGFGWRFVISLFTASASAYLEVFIISNNTFSNISSSYFSHFVAFTALSTFTSGFVGFLLTPLIRKYPKMWGNRVYKNLSYLILVTILISICASTIISYFFYDIFNKKLNYELMLILSIIASLRIIYVIPTSILGALADPKELNGFLYYGIFGVIIFVFFVIVGDYFSFNYIIVVSLASLLNWIIRTISSFYYSKKVFLKSIEK